MDHGQLRMVADKFQGVFSEPLLNTCGTETKFCRRQRIITPFRLGLALTITCASQSVETIADFHCAFNAFCGTTITYKAFYNQLAKPHFADFARTMTERLSSDMTLKVFGFEKGHTFSEFRHIILQDGSSFAIHDGLREVFPSRFKAVKLAAVELHTTMDLLCDAPTTVVLTPDTANEQAFLPEPAALRDSGLLADRGYIDTLSASRAGRARLLSHPSQSGHESAGRRSVSRRRQAPAIATQQAAPGDHTKLPKRQRVELGGQWQVDGHPLCLRLIISWNPRTKSFCYFLTNLPPQRYPLEVICRAYKWRWQVALLFKEWKSYANLHAFDTAKVAIVEGLIWTAIATAVLKRFLAYMTQLLAEVPMSTRKVAMCAVHVLGAIVRAVQSGDVAGLYAALKEAVTYLACHAQRAHPERDQHIGRLQLGLAPLLGSDGVIEFAEAA